MELMFTSTLGILSVKKGGQIVKRVPFESWAEKASHPHDVQLVKFLRANPDVWVYV